MKRLILGLLLTVVCSSCDDAGPEIEVAILDTSMGSIEMVLFPDVAPLAVQNFRTLARRGIYDGTTIHRVIPDFIIQGGDPTGTGYGSESAWGEPFEDEFDPSLRFDQAGRIGMANSGPDTNGSQFFIALDAFPHLNDHHTIFGQVVVGMEVVEAISRVPTDASSRPVEAVTVNRVRIIPAGLGSLSEER